MGFPGGSVVNNPPTNAEDTGDMDLIPGLEGSPREGIPFISHFISNPSENLLALLLKNI